jgi:arylsulfatase A
MPTMPELSLDRRNFLRCAAGAVSAATLTGAARTPNIVMILCDDLGYGDLHCYGSELETPNLDRMASQGVRFTNFYAANQVCSPSRAALMTGRYPTRVGVPQVLFPRDTQGLALDEVTLPQTLKKVNYNTMCVGKWHLGHTPKYLPTARGFDEYFGVPYSNDMTPRPLMHNTETLEEPAKLETLTPRYTEQAVKFIERSKDRPFFLYMPHTYPHIPLAASDRFRGKSKSGLYGDVIAEVDWSVGEVLNTLKSNHLDRNTLVFFSSDNGPWYQGSPGRLRGRKGWSYEGGVREPFIAWMPGRIPAGRVSNAVGSMMDIYPTVAKLCGAPLPAKPLDGIDLWPAITSKVSATDREMLLYFDNWNLQCARWKNWKIHVSRYNNMAYNPAPVGGRVNLPLPKPELYDLEIDADESYDVAAKHPEVVKEMTARLERLLADFPQEVKTAWAETHARETNNTSPGALPSPKKKP